MNNPSLLFLAVVSLSACGVVDGGGGSARKARAPIVSCPSTPAPQVFTRALCLCGDYQAVGGGAWVHGGASGINGVMDVVGEHRFGGDVLAWGGVSGVGELTVAGTLSTAGRVDGVGVVSVEGDLLAGSGVTNVGELTVKGTLFTPAPEESVGMATVGARAAYQPLSGPPCACGAGAALDVAAAITAAKAHNDDAAVGLDLEASVGERELTLGSGSYFFSGVSAVGQHTVTIDGAVALYVSGDFDTVGATHLALTEGSTLDLYVDGDVSMVGESSFGVGARPGAVRLYVAGERSVSLVGGQEVVGSLYAPASDVDLVGETKFQGSLFARNVTGVGELTIAAEGGQLDGEQAGLCEVVELN